jgi:hypothetical protein
VDEIADMDREVEDILQDSDQDSDGGETDKEQEPSLAEHDSSEQRQDKSEATAGNNSFKDCVYNIRNNRGKCDSTHSIFI